MQVIIIALKDSRENQLPNILSLNVIWSFLATDSICRRYAREIWIRIYDRRAGVSGTTELRNK